VAQVEAVVRTQGLTKDYGPVLALDALSVDIGSGITGLVGANGAGKSTLLKILLGLVSPTGGRAEVLGHDIATEGREIRAAVGYLPEHDCLPPDVSASDFVVHLAMMSGLPRVAARERAAEVLRHVGLAEERYRPMGGYSTGMRQKAKLAQALAHDPRLVLLDEPTNGLDPAARDEMLGLVQRIGRDFGIAVVVTSHLLGELERVSDHVVILDAGRLLRASATDEFLDKTGTLLVEVLGDDGPERMARALSAAGVSATPRGSLLAVDGLQHREEPGARELHDVIRDAAADLGLGLVRVQPDHRRIEDVFADAPPEPVPAPRPEEVNVDG
jgi:ABC-2 type transport system ATP-binding protein